MERLTYVTEKGEVLFHPEDLPDDKGMTITQLAKDGRFKALEIIAESLANHEQADELGVYGKWIPVSERLPEERNSIFAKYKGTDKWKTGMFVKISKTVIVTVDYPSGDKFTKSAHTVDGIWKLNECVLFDGKVIAWMPLPEPYRESEEEDAEM